MSIGSGTRLGPYEVQDFIGQGAMGVVYRAYHSALERTGAVKVMHAITPDPDTVTRFRHEAQAIARLRHPNIVDVYDFGEYQGTPYMIVEYMPRGSLAARMALGLLDRPTALRYLHGIAAGLDYAHSHGIVHRDIKPANVLLTDEDSPVLADFGLAKLMDGSSLKSLTGVTTGTPAYMAPEQVTGGQVGPAADRYALTTIAYEMLTGVIPFDGEALLELLYAQVHRYPSAPSARDQSLGPQVDTVIMRGLAKNPSDRWESCTALVDALAAALQNDPVPSGVAPTMVIAPPVARTRPIAPVAAVARKVAAPPPPATVAVAFPQPVTSPAVQTRTKPQGRRRIAMGVAALLVLLLLMGVCAIVAQATTLSVSPGRVAPGGTVTVTATHVPNNQVGQIQLWSVVHTYPFRADSKGIVRRDIVVPLDVNLGNHVVKICWDNSCHQQAPLVVVSGVADIQPTPVGGTTPGTTPSPSTAPSATSNPGSTPAPHSTPRPTSNPTANPTSHPTTPPTIPPTASPCPTPPGPATLTNPPATVLLSGTIPVTGQAFIPNAYVTVEYIQGSSVKASKTVRVACNGTFATSFPSPLLGGGTITANDGTRTASKNFTVVL